MSFDLTTRLRGRMEGFIAKAPPLFREHPQRRRARDKNVRAKNGRSLVGRLATALVVTAILIYVAAVAGLWWTGGSLIEDSARKQAVQWLAEFDELGTPLYASRQPSGQALRALTARLNDFPEIAYVRYYDASGAQLLGEYTGGAPASPPASLLAPDRLERMTAVAGNRPYRLARMGSARVRVTAPLQVRTLPPDALLDLARASGRESIKVIGYLDFVFDAGEQRVQFQRSLIGGSVALALALCVAVVLGRRKVRQALAPLTALEEPLARLAQGDMNVDMGGGGDREIAAIREALNTTVAALKQRDEALRHVECDALTGLVNRRYFEHQLALECGRVAANGETSAVLCIDLDRFREVNDGLGAAAGDRLLGQVAGLLRARVRGNDLLARLGGDEFVALIRGVNRDGAIKVARSINQVLHELEASADEELFPISASIGIAVLDAAHLSPEAVMAQAHAACAHAKARGGNRHYLHDYDDAAVARDTHGSAWSRHVRTAIQDKALKFMYQPIVDLRNGGGGEAYELLLRLAAPGGQLVSPTAFLPVADHLGLMVELDQWVIRRACEELARLHAGGRRATFFVNLSGHAFEEGETLMRAVGAQLARRDLSGEHLVFEITEQAAVRRLNQARMVIEGLGTLGCRFALDDFGSGFSSLNYLKHLPVAFIKISGTFVRNLGTDAFDEVMVRSIVQMANALEMQTVAESVEDLQVLRRIAELGVDFAQGHALARPAEKPAGGEFFASTRVHRLTALPPARLPSRVSARRSLTRKQ